MRKNFNFGGVMQNTVMPALVVELASFFPFHLIWSLVSVFGQILIEGEQTGQELVPAGSLLTIVNKGPSVVYLSDQKITRPGDVNTQTPLAVNASVTYTGPVWGACIPGESTTIDKHPGGTNFFSLSRAVANATISSTPPSNPAIGDIWFDSSNDNQMQEWNGTAWVPVTFGTNAITAGSITAALVAANTVVAGIVDGTTITAATFEGTDFTINTDGVFRYSGTTLIYTETNTSGTDVDGNAYLPGNTSYYLNTGGSITAVQKYNGQITFYTAPSSAGPFTEVCSISSSSGLELNASNVISLLSNIGAGLSIGNDIETTGNILLGARNVIQAADPVIGGAATWNPITTDSGWTVPAGYSAPQYIFTAEGNVQFTGMAGYSSSITGSKALNSANPLPSPYIPPTTKVVSQYGAVGSRCRVELHTDGVLYAIGTSTYPGTYAELESTISLRK